MAPTPDRLKEPPRPCPECKDTAVGCKVRCICPLCGLYVFKGHRCDELGPVTLKDIR